MVWFGTVTGVKKGHLESALKDPSTAKKTRHEFTQIPMTGLKYDVEVIDLCAQIKITERFEVPFSENPLIENEPLEMVYELVITESDSYHVIGLEVNGTSTLTFSSFKTPSFSHFTIPQDTGRYLPETNALFGPYVLDKAGDSITVVRAPLGAYKHGRKFTVTAIIATQLEVDEMTCEYIFRLPRAPVRVESTIFSPPQSPATVNLPSADDLFAAVSSADAASALFDFGDDDDDNSNTNNNNLNSNNNESKNNDDASKNIFSEFDENEGNFSLRVDVKMPTVIRSVYSPSRFEDIEFVPQEGDPSAGAIEASSADFFDPADEFIAFIKLANPSATSVRAYRRSVDSQEYSVCALFPMDAIHWEAAVAAKPGDNGAAATARGHEVSFIVDNSGSMIGAKLDAAKDAVKYALRALPEGTLINIYKLGSSFQSLFIQSEPLDDSTLARATAYVNEMDGKMGATRLLEPLICAIQRHATASSPCTQNIVLLTDGAVENTREFTGSISKYAAKTGSSRVFTLGIAPDVNAHLVQELTRATSGYCEIVEDPVFLRAAMTRMLKALIRPTINNASVAWKGFGSVSQPKSVLLPSAFITAYAVVTPPTGYAATAEPTVVTISGLVAGVPYERTISVDLAKAFCGAGTGPAANGDRGAQIACLCAVRMLSSDADSAETVALANCIPSRYVATACGQNAHQLLVHPFMAASFRSEELAHYRAHVQTDSAADMGKAKEEATAAAVEAETAAATRDEKRSRTLIFLGAHRKAQQKAPQESGDYKLPVAPPKITSKLRVFGFDLFNFVRRKNNILKQRDLKLVIDENPLYEADVDFCDNVMYTDPELGASAFSTRSVPSTPRSEDPTAPPSMQPNNPGIAVNPFFQERGEQAENPIFDDNPLLGTFEDSQKRNKSAGASPYLGSLLNPLLDPEDDSTPSPTTATVTIKDVPRTLSQDALVLAQHACGRWTLMALKDCGISIRDLSKAIPDAKKHKEAMDVWTTFVVIGFLKAYFSRNYVMWQLVAEKAKKWACGVARGFGGAPFNPDEWSTAAAHFIASLVGSSSKKDVNEPK